MQQTIASGEVTPGGRPKSPAACVGVALTTRLTLSGALSMIALAGLIIFASLHHVSEHIRDNSLHRARAIAAAFDQALNSAEDFEDAERLNGMIAERIRMAPEILSVTVFKSSNAGLIAFASSRPGMAGKHAGSESFAALREDRLVTREIEIAGDPALLAISPLHLSGKQAGSLQFEIARENIMHLRLELLASMLVAFLPLIVIMVLLLMFFIRRRIVSPVAAIGKLAREITQGSYDLRLEIDDGGEFRPLYRDFNQMLSSLELRRSEVIEAKQHYQHQALHDSLTGLPNRSYLHQRFPQYLAVCKRHRRRAAMMLMDLDNFKWVNDNLGHAAGDALLVEISRRLQMILRQEDFIVRLGGDEFVVVISEISGETGQALHQIESVVDSILENISRPVNIEANEVQVSASIGIVFFPGREDQLAEILNSADSAMYRAKELGGNRGCFFDQKMQQLMVNKANVLDTIKQAIDSNQLRIYYQPQVDGRGRVVGAEALVRWLHPQKGLLLPGEFLSAIENSSLIVELGQWVFETACRQYRALCERYAAGPEFSIAINICSAQFGQADFIEQIVATLERHRLPPCSLVLEITESTLMQNPAEARDRIDSIKRHGIRVSIDDYGTGCSSLTCLKNLDLDEIKLDCDLVRGISGTDRDREMVCAIVNMSKSLRLNLVAEGVETKEQYDFLKALDCRAFQGRHFQEPMPLSRPDT